MIPNNLRSLPELKPPKSLRKENDIYLLGGLMLIGLLLRLPSLNLGLWRDEGSTYFDVLPANLGELIKTIIYSELNPPGFYLIMHQWMQWFGAGEVVFKLPAFGFGLLLIPATYTLGRVVSSRRTGLIAAAITTFAFQSIYYSQEARPYSLTALLCCLVVLMYCKALLSKHQTWYLAGFVICASLLLYVQYTGLLLIGSLAIATLYLLWHRTPNVRLISFAIAFGSIFLLFTPWLQIFLTHLYTGTPWTEKEPWFIRPMLFFKNIASTIPIGKDKKFWAGVLFILFALYLEAKQLFYLRGQSLQPGRMPLNPSKVVLNICLVVPAFLAAVLSYDSRYMFPFTPIAWVLYAWWLTAFFKYINSHWTSRIGHFSKRVVLVLLILLLILPNSIDTLFLGNSDKSGIRSLAADWREKLNQKTIYLLNPDYFGPTFGYYFAQYPVKFYGFGRWNHPETFSPQGYVEVWNNPTLVSDTEKRIQNEAQKSYQKLALIQESGKVDDRGEMRYSQANQLLSRLKQIYPLLQTKDYPGYKESVTLYVFALTPRQSIE
ncbi:hypothetical protein SD81_004390 [Tolypothrix campylonemoides VB511288]|nr:hypothetical protein SD81_004390 [Tolypothrix campylonemoides VB511288]